MRAYKGLPSLLKAVGDHPDLRLTVAGDGALAPKYRDITARLSPRTTWVGAVDDEELRVLYRQHDVIVLPSERRVEAFGLVLIEGMAAGCVPVASDLPGVRDVAGPTGLLFPPGDVTQLRRTLLRLAHDREMCHRLSEASTARASSYGAVEFSRRYERSLDAALDARRRSRFAQPIPSLGRSGRSPSLADLTRDFSASWASVLWFDRASGRILQGWGRAGEGAAPNGSLVARYVAARGAPTVIDLRSAPNDLAQLLDRDDIGSAVATPILSSRGWTGVVSLTRAFDSTSFRANDANRLANRFNGHGRHQGNGTVIRQLWG